MEKSKVIQAFEDQLKASLENLYKRDLELAAAAQGEEEYGSDRLASKQEEFLDEAGSNDSVQAALQDSMLALKGIDNRTYSKVEPGALVITDQISFLVCAALREIEVDGKAVVGISIQSPAYQAMEGKGAGDRVDLNGRTLTITEIA